MIPASANSASAWTSRQRLLTALSGGVPDRVPINTYELAGRNSLDWYNIQPSYRGLMDCIRAHTDCITNWNPRTATDRYTCEERFLCSDFPVEMETRKETIDEFERTTKICHTPQGDLRSVAQSTPDVYTTWRIEHWCKTLTDVDKALSVPYQPASYDASDLTRVRAELGDHGLVMASIGDPAYLAADLMSFQDYLMWASLETDHFAQHRKRSRRAGDGEPATAARLLRRGSLSHRRAGIFHASLPFACHVSTLHRAARYGR